MPSITNTKKQLLKTLILNGSASVLPRFFFKNQFAAYIQTLAEKKLSVKTIITFHFIKL